MPSRHSNSFVLAGFHLFDLRFEFRFFLRLLYGFSTLNITIPFIFVVFNVAVLIATPPELLPPTMSSKTFTVSAALCLALVFSPTTALAAPQMVSLMNKI